MTDRLLTFSHIPKTAGTTLRNLLRTTFGLRHVDVYCRAHKNPRLYGVEDLRKDIALHPWAKSIAGHGPVAYMNYGEYDERMVWYTMFREPVNRFLSQYKFYCQINGNTKSIEKWASQRPYKNFQVSWVAGSQDITAAKDLLCRRFKAVGLVERFDESLLILRKRIGLSAMDLSYFRYRNRARTEAYRQRIDELKREYEELIWEHNHLDIELYRFVRDEVWPKQVQDYGGSDVLASDMRSVLAQRREKRTTAEELRYFGNILYRNAVYKPFARLDKGAPLTS